MKIIILHPDSITREIIRNQINRLHHVVLHEDTTVGHILLAVATHRPHLIVAEEPEPFVRSRIDAKFEELSLDVPILWYPPAFVGAAEEGWLTTEISRLLDGSGCRPLTRYTDDCRSFVRDVGYEAFEDGAKRNLPELSADQPQGLALEMKAFGQQVECALQHHADARHYLRQVLLTDKGLKIEATYRALHGSHKVYWLREHIYRWVSVLAHYLPGVEPVYLPPPAPPSPKFDFLAYMSPPESQYAATALIIHGFKPSWMSPLRSILSMKFHGQDEAALLAETLTLAGWSFLLREIAVAQVRAMECALRPDRPWYTNGLPTRALHRASQTYCDFWHLRHLRTNPEYLRLVADWVVVDGVRSSGVPPVVPPFRHYVATPDGAIPKT